VDGLFDVTTCAMGAYPQTASEIAVRSLLKGAKRSNQVFIPTNLTGTASTSTTLWTPQEIGTRSSGAEGNADQPAPDPAPEPEESGAAEEAAPNEGQDPPAAQPDQPDEKPEDREAKEREFKLWQQKRAAEHRRTREFAFGVTSQQETEK